MVEGEESADAMKVFGQKSGLLRQVFVMLVAQVKGQQLSAVVAITLAQLPGDEGV
jgi:hypothetical protein